MAQALKSAELSPRIFAHQHIPDLREYAQLLPQLVPDGQLIFSTPAALSSHLAEPAMPLISVVIPTYNVAISERPIPNSPTYVQGMLQSVIQQRYPNIEILIVDDGSTDQTAPQLMEFANQHPELKIRITMQSHTGYNSRVRNHGIRLLVSAKSELLTLMDGDDTYADPNSIERLATPLIENPKLIMTIGAMNFMSADGQCIEPSIFLQRGKCGTLEWKPEFRVTEENVLQARVPGYLPARMWRTERTYLFPEYHKTHIDLAQIAYFYAESYQCHGSLCGVLQISPNYPIYNYRRHGASVSHQGTTLSEKIASDAAAARSYLSVLDPYIENASANRSDLISRTVANRMPHLKETVWVASVTLWNHVIKEDDIQLKDWLKNIAFRIVRDLFKYRLPRLGGRVLKRLTRFASEG